MAKFKFAEVLLDGIHQTARVADDSSNMLTEKDVGKFLKLKGDSQYGLCAATNPIEAVLVQTNTPTGTFDGYTLGTIRKGGRLRVTFGEVLNVGDYVVAGTVAARGTALTAPPTVAKFNTPTGAFQWRVVSLDGTTAAGQTGVIECVSGAGTGTSAA